MYKLATPPRGTDHTPCQDTLELTTGFGGLRSWLGPWTQALGILCGRSAHVYPDSFPSVAIETPLIKMQIFLSFSLRMLFLRQLLFSAPQWDPNVWPKGIWDIYVQAGSTEQRTIWVEMRVENDWTWLSPQCLQHVYQVRKQNVSRP